MREVKHSNYEIPSDDTGGIYLADTHSDIIMQDVKEGTEITVKDSGKKYLKLNGKLRILTVKNNDLLAVEE